LIQATIAVLHTYKPVAIGVTMLLWKEGKCVTWVVTVSDTLAQSYVNETSQTPGAAAKRKTNK